MKSNAARFAAVSTEFFTRNLKEIFWLSVAVKADLRAVVVVGGMLSFLVSSNALALDEPEEIFVAVYEHEIAQRMGSSDSRELIRELPPSQSFCLSQGGLSIRSLENLPQEVGDGISSNVVSELRARGYDVFSATDCVYDVDGHGDFIVRPRSLTKPALLIFVAPRTTDNATWSFSAAYWAGQLACGGHTMNVERMDGRYVITDMGREFIC